MATTLVSQAARRSTVKNRTRLAIDKATNAIMKAIQTSFTQDGTVFCQDTEYVIEIQGKWFKVCHGESYLYDSSAQDSCNICKWSSYGTIHHFSIEECEPPAKDLPAEVKEFVERYLATGSKNSELRVHHKNGGNHPGDTPPANAAEGWSDPPPRSTAPQDDLDDNDFQSRGFSRR